MDGTFDRWLPPQGIGNLLKSASGFTPHFPVQDIRLVLAVHRHLPTLALGFALPLQAFTK